MSPLFSSPEPLGSQGELIVYPSSRRPSVRHPSAASVRPPFLAHLSQRLIGELIVYQSSRRLCRTQCVHVSIRALTLSNMNISATSWPIGMKFYLKHHYGGGKASVGFDLDRIRTLVSMATDSSHRVIMGKTASSHFLECF